MQGSLASAAVPTSTLQYGEPGSLVGTLKVRVKELNCASRPHPLHLPRHVSNPTALRGDLVGAHVSQIASCAAFVIGAAVSLATSWLLVSRLERVGERFGLTEALLGLVAALAADAPEITASITALVHHQPTIGAGVVLGSNVFNLAALLGLGAVVAGHIALHRKVVVLSGVVAMAIGAGCLLSVGKQLPAGGGLAVVLAVFVPFVILLGAHRRILGRLRLSPRLTAWLDDAIVEEETEFSESIHPDRGTSVDALVAAGALVVVVVASVAMERGASSVGAHFGVPAIIIGGLVLAAVTSLPNAVSAIYLARRGRGAATLSTALNSNSLNVIAGLLIPATVIGLARPSAPGLLVAGWYVGLTALVLVLAYAGHGVGRARGGVIIAAYALFVVVLLVIS
jgi:cation:H+ antiporter